MKSSTLFLLASLAFTCSVNASSYDIETVTEKNHKKTYILEVKKTPGRTQLNNHTDAYFLFSGRGKNDCYLALAPGKQITWQEVPERCLKENTWLLKYAEKIKLFNYKNYSTYDNKFELKFSFNNPHGNDFIITSKDEPLDKNDF